MTRPRVFPATVVKIHDGDTAQLAVTIDLLWSTAIIPASCRLAGCNARELKDPGGREARDHLAGLLPTGTKTTVTVVAIDKYSGRFDGHLALPDGQDAATAMIADGYAAAWSGKGTRPAPPWPIPGTGQ